MTTKLIALMSLMAALCAGACTDDIDRTTDCADICNRYKDCASSDYDVKACTDRCDDMTSENKTERIDACETCLDDKSCTGSVFNCATECIGIVP